MSKPNTLTISNASLFLDALYERGIRHVFANAGTDFAPVIEALVIAREQGRPMPEFHTVPHENVAVSMAHGYYRVTGEPVAVMVHVTVGTANALCGLMNAARDNVPLLLMAGRTPHTEAGNQGSRNASIHWGQDAFDQGGMLREYVKWDYELRAGQPVDAIVGRALDIAMTEPPGPVYLALPRETLGDPAPALQTHPRRRSPGASPAMPNHDEIEKVAQILSAAESPIVVTESLGRDFDNVGLLGRLADEFGIGVAHAGEPGARDVNIPLNHPMYLGTHPIEALEQADVIVAIDTVVPWWPRYVSLREDVRLVQIGPDPLYTNYPVRGFDMDQVITGSSSAALAMLHEALQVAAADKDRIQRRHKAFSAQSRERIQSAEKLIEEVRSMAPIHPAWLASCINEIKDPSTIIVNELGVPMDFLDLREPGTFIGTSPAGGLGFGNGGALGARMGAPDRNVILVVGDGSYMFGNPVAAHYVARAKGLPTLTIINNNQRWHAVHRSTLAMYPDGQSARVPLMPLVDLGPSPAFEKVIESIDGYSEHVDDPAELPAALRRAMDAVAGGTPALLNVITQGG
ncbi:MAG: thiamine pyrophosphate-requiring protein [Gammaproteobacteria bacterium]